MNDILNLAFNAWIAGTELRQRRQRYKRYTYGRQWDDIVLTPNGEVMDEGSYASQSGRHPLTNNLIRQLVKCVIGNFRSSILENDPAAEAPVDDATARRNSLTELDCRMLEEFLISGCAIQRVVAEKRMNGCGVWVDNVSPESFFVNRFIDPRGLDIELVGMLHSMSMREVLMRFGKSDGKRRKRIERIYNSTITPPLGAMIGTESSIGFFNAEQGRCRVIEVWTLESRNIIKCHDTESGRLFVSNASKASDIEKANKLRSKQKRAGINFESRTTLRWRCRFLTPDGEVLDEFDSPYAHGMHPFAVKFYPLTDGEVHSFVEDVIDQQRHVNRLITLIDHIMNVSAKGVLLFPIQQKPDFMSWYDVGKAWAQCNSVIPYDPRHSSQGPQQVISSGENVGAYHLLEMQLQLFQQVSGVSDALQGKVASPATSAALFDSQLRSSAIAILDLLDSFNNFRLQRNNMIINS